MNKEELLKSRRTFALSCPAIFFTLAFWSLGLLLGTAAYFLVTRPSHSLSASVKHLISLTPVASVSVQDSPSCPQGSRLLFSLDLPGFSDASCYRELDEAPYIEIGTGWWKCNSGLFGAFTYFESTQTSSVWNLGAKFVCVEEFVIPIDDFYYSAEASQSGVDKSSAAKSVEVRAILDDWKMRRLGVLLSIHFICKYAEI